METLQKLCDRVIAMDVPFDDVRDELEDLAYYEYGHGGLDDVVAQFERLAAFLEGMRNKNEEVCRDLAHVYLLIGQVFQFAGLFDRSIPWLNKSLVVDDMYPAPYHALAVSFINIGDETMAMKCFEREITVEPGNYYTYLALADLYEKNGQFDNFEKTLARLLERDPSNIKAMHRMIRYCERGAGLADPEFMRRKLLARTDGLSRIEAIIRAYHLAHVGRRGDAIAFLKEWSEHSPDVSIVHLAAAHIYGMDYKFVKKRRELAVFTSKNGGRVDLMNTKIGEFASVFGDEAAESLKRRLQIAYGAW